MNTATMELTQVRTIRVKLPQSEYAAFQTDNGAIDKHILRSWLDEYEKVIRDYFPVSDIIVSIERVLNPEVIVNGIVHMMTLKSGFEHISSLIYDLREDVNNIVFNSLL